MGELGARHLRSFDPAWAQVYASVSSDNRLRLWNTASGELRQTYVEPQHLSKRYTCMAWHRPNSKVSPQSSTGAPKPSTLGWIALGTDKGTITVWALKRGTVTHSLGEGEGPPGVTSVVFSADGTSLFSASSARDIIEWNLETGAVVRKLKGHKQGSTHMCLHPAGKVLAIASASIRLIDLTTGKVARKFSGGHAGAVRLLSFSPDGRYLASSASSARFVNVFDVAGEVPSAEPVATLGFAAIPTFLALHATVGGEEGDRITAIAGFDVGGVSVLRTRRRADGKDGGVSKIDISGADGAASPSALLGCLSHDRPSSAVLIATGSPASPGFTEVLFEDDAGALLPSAAVEGGVSPEQEREEDEPLGEKGPLTHVVGPGELGIRGKEKDSAADAGEGLRAEDEDGRAAKRLKATGGGEGDAGMTIAERLEALSEAIDRDAETAVGARKRRGGEEEGALQPRAESLSTVLTQALQSGDESLLEQCLAVGNQDVIEATVERLASSKVLPFLLRVVGKLEKNPNRSAALGQWIRALLSCHLGYLVSVPGLPEKLALLHQLIDRRVASFPKLLQLHGRLDLLLARAKSDGGGSRRRDGGRAMDAPEAVYREEDEEDEGKDEEESEGIEADDEEGEDEQEDDGEAEDEDEQEHDEESDEMSLDDQQDSEELD
ncbi:unnamed protein product [Ascophyllum nodosum]